jgi:TIR domain-containing protein
MAHDVFISHSAKDKATADAVCAKLEAEGIRCWIAPRDVTPGLEWGAAIIGAIKQAKVMVLVFTANANASQQIRREVERAVHHDVAILPFRVENIVPDESLEYFIGNLHWLDALTPPLEAHLRSLVRTIKSLLAAP